MIFIYNYAKSIPNIRHFTNNAALFAKNHYDSLGITPKATQADVKTAYYKLSLLYHPDKNEGCEDASNKFREVTEAYEVLGNVRTRRLYDKGIRNYNVLEKAQPVYRREQKDRPPPPTGKTPIYDFDEWARAHYGSTFAKDLRIQEAIRRREKQKETHSNYYKTEKVMITMFVLVGLSMLLTQENYDEVVINNNSVPKEK